MHARDGASDDESLDLGSPLEDGVDAGRTSVCAGHAHYFQTFAPQTSDWDRCAPTRIPGRPTNIEATSTISHTYY